MATVSKKTEDAVRTGVGVGVGFLTGLVKGIVKGVGDGLSDGGVDVDKIVAAAKAKMTKKEEAAKTQE